jgi:acyl-CoA synthetase (AMP-forming)/AMP-acid ligase II
MVYHGLKTLLGVPVVEQYASSETGIISLNIPPRRGSVGIPVIEHLQILNDNDTCAGPYEQGEIVVKGESVFSGYEDAPDENRAAFINGWFRTGDIGYLDDDGYLFITGRRKALINNGGQKISPEEIDSVLKSHPRVRDAMTFGIAEAVLGEDIAAMVVPLNTQITETDLRMFLLDHLIPSKVPRRIYFVDTIPRNPAGKPLRYEGTKRYSRV